MPTGTPLAPRAFAGPPARPVQRRDDSGNVSRGRACGDSQGQGLAGAFGPRALSRAGSPGRVGRGLPFQLPDPGAAGVALALAAAEPLPEFSPAERVAQSEGRQRRQGAEFHRES
jgi:hypothetical protein